MSSDAEMAAGATRQGEKAESDHGGGRRCLQSVSPASPLLSAPPPPRGPGTTAVARIKKPAIRRALERSAECNQSGVQAARLCVSTSARR